MIFFFLMLYSNFIMNTLEKNSQSRYCLVILSFLSLYVDVFSSFSSSFCYYFVFVRSFTSSHQCSQKNLVGECFLNVLFSHNKLLSECQICWKMILFVSSGMEGVHFIFLIKYYRFNSVHTITSFKILNDLVFYKLLD